MKISVIIPCYNQGVYLKDAVESVLNQTYSLWECIIINDGSSDDTYERCKELEKLDSRIKSIQISNVGVAKARNHALQVAKGNLVQFLDADDKIQKYKFEHAVTKIINSPDIDAVISDVRYFDNANPEELRTSLTGIGAEWMTSIWNENKPIQEKLIENNIMPINSPVIRRELIIKAGLFNEDLKTMEDWNLWAKCALLDANFYFESTPGTFALVRSHGDSVSNNQLLMYKGHFLHSVNIGSYINDPNLKKLNFSLGVLRLKQYKPNYTLLEIIQLFLANISYRNFIILRQTIFNDRRIITIY
jgi:glycosyltransferase involved in cell wall biosynthesis